MGRILIIGVIILGASFGMPAVVHADVKSLAQEKTQKKTKPSKKKPPEIKGFLKKYCDKYNYTQKKCMKLKYGVGLEGIDENYINFLDKSSLDDELKWVDFEKYIQGIEKYMQDLEKDMDIESDINEEEIFDEPN